MPATLHVLYCHGAEYLYWAEHQVMGGGGEGGGHCYQFLKKPYRFEKETQKRPIFFLKRDLKRDLSLPLLNSLVG